MPEPLEGTQNLSILVSIIDTIREKHKKRKYIAKKHKKIFYVFKI